MDTIVGCSNSNEVEKPQLVAKSKHKKPKIRRRKFKTGLTDASQKPITSYFPSVDGTDGCQNGKRKLENIHNESLTKNKKPRVGKSV